MILPILNIIRKLVNNMYKSLAIIGFFLLSSLIFGSANMMILEGAAAQDYYNEDRQYEDSYLGYRDDNNNYGYDYNKKYVCENGPFEGFLVSSVEFCKPDITVPTDFPTIQAAINASNPGDTIKVLHGIYTEQLTISKNLTIIGSDAKSTIINAPAVLNNGVIGFPYIVEVNNGAEVSMKGFTINGYEVSNCGNTPVDGVTGFNVQEGATLNLDSSTIRDCTFIGVRVGAPPFLPNGQPVPNGPQVGHATITNTDITDYTSFGIVAFTADSTLTVTKSNIIASDTSNIPGQTGIFVLGAKGKITHNEVSGNICNLPDICGSDFFNQFQGYGIIVDSAPGSRVSNNYVSNNDVGIGVFGTSVCCKIDYNKLTDNRFFGIIVSDGEHTISNTKIFRGNVGVAAIASNADTVATLDHVKIIGATIPVQEIPSGGFTAEVVILPNSFQNSKDGKPYFDSEGVIY